MIVPSRPLSTNDSITVDFLTSFEDGDPVPFPSTVYDLEPINFTEVSPVKDMAVSATDPTCISTHAHTPMTTTVTSGPLYSATAKTGVGFTGSSCLSYSGFIPEDGEARATNRLFDVNVTVKKGMELSYKVFPVLDTGVTYAATHIAVDLECDDGTRLSTYQLADRDGFPYSASAQGQSQRLWPDQWNSVKVDLSPLEGKTIQKILLDYHFPHGKANTRVEGFIDDLALQQASVFAINTPDGLISYVDTRRGTNSSNEYSRGNNFPAVAWPNGFNFITPLTNAHGGSTLYEYHAANNSDNRPTLNGIGFSHEPSIWMGERHQLAFMPSDEPNPASSADARRLPFEHQHEIARPDIYRVLFDNGISAAVTATDHGGLFSFTFSGETGSVIADAEYSHLSISASGLLTGWIDGCPGGYPGKTRMFVYGQFDTVPLTFGNPPDRNDGTSQYATFNTSRNKTVQLHVATSFISLTQAKKNYAIELSGRSFTELHNAVKAAWNQRLSVITDIHGASDEQLITVYSQLYRMNLYPNSQYENMGTVECPVFRYASPVSPVIGAADDNTTNAQVFDGKIYVNNGFWDTYRTEWPAIGLFYPYVAEELVDGFLQQYRDGGWIARWSSPGYADLMTGTSSDAAFSEVDACGRLSTHMALEAYDAALKNATVLPPSDHVGRKGIDQGIFLGYTTADIHQSVSWGMEGFINDAAIAHMAKRLADNPMVSTICRKKLADDAAYFTARQKSFANMFNPLARTFASRNADGNWGDGADMDKRDWSSAFTEASAWTFAYHVPFDIDGLAALYGSRRELLNDLHDFLSTPELAEYSTIHEAREARDVRLGMLGMSNQPAHHIPYVLAEAGNPAAAQSLIADICKRLFVGSDIGQGYPGDEDNGEMSAWFIFSALGFYPLAVGSGNYTVGTPLFDSATIHLGNSTVVINATGASAGKKYVSGMSIDGQEITSITFDGDLIRQPGSHTITFSMSDSPSSWGTKALDDYLDIPTAPVDITGQGMGILSIDTRNDAGARIEDGDNDADTVTGGHTPTPKIDVLIDDSMRTSITFTKPNVRLTWTSHNGPIRVDRYTLTSVRAQSAPRSWSLCGSIDGITWTVLDRRSDEEFPHGTQLRPFTIAKENRGDYTMYKLDIASGSSRSNLQLTQIELFAADEG